MSLLVRKMRGINLYARDAVKPRWYPDPTAPAAWVEVWAVDTDKPVTVEHAKLLGRFSPGQQNIAIDFNPAADRYKELRAVSFSAAGVRNVRYLDDAPAVTVLFNRLSSAPTIAQSGAASETDVTIAVTGFDSSLVRAREVQNAANNTFTTGLSSGIAEGINAIAPLFALYGSAADTRYIRVRHSSTGASGPWSAWSNVLMITFASPGGGGGTSGDYNPGGGIYDY